ncbi:ABC transporter permease [Spiroplasma culicicola]|uniref:ABC transporter ATP-binding protein n=1 Tax=Spiroplasma culicicola AES-1 TaxID=1276246 RepID=W6A7K5_9MOLU|nr:ABC transporter permease [Spiroplasma culicicola]AHI52967.1 ABC transporter ATP-binding protein [Spiroplasma culicicola AES-1]
MEQAARKKTTNFKFESRIFANLMLIISKSFFKSPKGLIFTLVVPICFALMFFFIMGNKFAGHFSLLGYTILPAIAIIMSLSSSIVEWKNSIFLKRIENTGIKKSLFLISLWLFYLMICIASFIIMLLFVMIMGAIIAPNYQGANQDQMNSSIFVILKNINWGLMLFSVLLVSLTSIVISTFIGGILKTEGSANGISLMIFFFSLFWSGIVLPSNMFENTKGMLLSTYLVPFKYSFFIFLYATQGKVTQLGWEAPFNNHGDVGYDFTATWQPVLISLLLITIVATTTVFTFKWISRK